MTSSDRGPTVSRCRPDQAIWPRSKGSQERCVEPALLWGGKLRKVNLEEIAEGRVRESSLCFRSPT